MAASKAMLKNYLKVAFRNLWRNKAFSALNIIGLSSGLAVCLLIVLYVKDELSYDHYLPTANRVYRLDADIFFNGTPFSSSTAPEPMGPTLVKNYPQIGQMTRVINWGDLLIKKGDKFIQAHNAVFADSSFFAVFPFPLISGNPATALTEPHSIVIDESMARSYFNSIDVLGKTIRLGDTTDCKVTGVMKDIPTETHFHFHLIRSFRDFHTSNDQDWLFNNTHTYILTRPGVSVAFINQSIETIINTYLSKELEDVMHSSVSDLRKHGGHFAYQIMPLTDIHLYSNKSYEFEANGNLTYIYIFSIIATFILLIACVNFMNLSTARSANRAKEVGIRKVTGSLRSNLIFQFLIESIVITLISLLLALFLAAMVLPMFNQLAGKEMTIDSLITSWLLPELIALTLVVGFIAGSYPAFYLSSFQPIQVLKGSLAKGFKSNWLRSSLVVFQFSISIVLIIGTLVIYSQLDYIRKRDVGFKRDQVLVLHNTYVLDKQISVFRDELRPLAGIENVTVAGDMPTSNDPNQNGWFLDPNVDVKKALIMTNFTVDEHFIPTLGMQMASGRNFSKDYPSDSTGVIINEAAVKALGFKDPLKEFLYQPSYLTGDNHKIFQFHVVGVVKDFNYNTMHEKVGPLIVKLGDSQGDWGSWSNVAIRMHTQNIPALLGQIEAKWNSMASGHEFIYSFMDNDFNNIYKAEQHTGRLFFCFAAFAIFIACLGLFGLVTYAAEQRTKEIGIRKVLGASTGGIVTMLSKDFARLVGIAALIAFPLAWWMMNQWLQSYAYRVSIGWWIFVLAGLTTIVIALATVSFQAFKAAMANPADSLRSE